MIPVAEAHQQCGKSRLIRPLEFQNWRRHETCQVISDSNLEMCGAVYGGEETLRRHLHASNLQCAARNVVLPQHGARRTWKALDTQAQER